MQDPENGLSAWLSAYSSAACGRFLNCASAAGRDVVSVGKIADIFSHSGTGRVLKADGNEAMFEATLEGAASLADGGLLLTNSSTSTPLTRCGGLCGSAGGL
jgi:phosphopentomutase